MHNSKSAAHLLSSTWPLVYKDRTPILPKRDITRDSFYEKERQPNRWYSHQRNDYTQYALNKKGPGNQRYLLIHVLVCFLLFMNQEMDHHQSWLILTDHVGQSHFPSETVPKGGWSRAGTQTPLFYFPSPGSSHRQDHADISCSMKRTEQDLTEENIFKSPSVELEGCIHGRLVSKQPTFKSRLC